MTIATTRETVGGGDYRGLASARGTEHPVSGTLDVSTLVAGEDYPDGYVPALLPVQFNAGSGLYEKCDDTDTHLTLAGFVWHDVTVRGAADLTIAVLTDATIIAEFIPGDHDLTDGRYLTDRVDTDPAPEGDGGGV